MGPIHIELLKASLAFTASLYRIQLINLKQSLVEIFTKWETRHEAVGFYHYSGQPTIVVEIVYLTYSRDLNPLNHHLFPPMQDAFTTIGFTSEQCIRNLLILFLAFKYKQYFCSGIHMLPKTLGNARSLRWSIL